MDSLPVDYSKKWWVMAAVAFEVFLATIDGSIVNIALNTLVEQLHEPLALVEWVILAYFLVISTMMLSVGRLADMFGKKKLYATGMAIFTIGSAMCGLSPNIYWLIGSRIFQAVGASMNMALGTAIITEAFPDQERGKAMGVIGLLVSIGVIAGPTLGGIILQYLSWHWLFFVNLPIGVVGFFMVLRFVPIRRPVGHQKFDFLGAGTLFVSMAAFLLALSIIQTDSVTNPLVYIFAAIFLIMTPIFVWVEYKAEQPMIDLHLFVNRLFSINLITGFLTFVASAGVTLLIPLYLQNMMGFDPQKTGILMIVSPLAMALAAPISGALSDRVGPRVLTTVGLVIAATGYFSFISLNTHTTTIMYILGYAAIGIGMGIFQSPNNSAVMGSAPKERLGVASGLLSLTRVLGQTAGVSILGAVWETYVFKYAGSINANDATQAPIPAQVAGLHDALILTVAIVLLAVAFSSWALLTVRRAKSRSVLVENSLK